MEVLEFLDHWILKFCSKIFQFLQNKSTNWFLKKCNHEPKRLQNPVFYSSYQKISGILFILNTKTLIYLKHFCYISDIHWLCTLKWNFKNIEFTYFDIRHKRQWVFMSGVHILAKLRVYGWKSTKLLCIKKIKLYILW